MRRSLNAICLSVTILAISCGVAKGQAQNGAGAGKNMMSVDFYKLPPGHQDEWLELYKKYHLPIMKYQKEHGQVISETLYTRAVHELSPSWDIAIVIIAPPPEKRPKAEKTRGEIVRSLFPNMDDYVKGEKARWAMTLEHWDESWTEVDIENHPSLYIPY